MGLINAQKEEVLEIRISNIWVSFFIIESPSTIPVWNRKVDDDFKNATFFKDLRKKHEFYISKFSIIQKRKKSQISTTSSTQMQYIKVVHWDWNIGLDFIPQIWATSTCQQTINFDMWWKSIKVMRKLAFYCFFYEK